MGNSVGKAVGTSRGGEKTGDFALQIRVLGPLDVCRHGESVPLPRSRKVRALLAFLALGEGAASRSRLCDLLWDVPNDPRGELRWCLSKLRGVLDGDDRTRVVAIGTERISLDLSDCLVDALEVDRALRGGAEHLTPERMTELREWFGGDLLEGLQIDGSPEFNAWLSGQRQRYRALHVSVLRQLALRAPADSDERMRCLHDWLGRAPFDLQAHEVMLAALVKRRSLRDAEQHFSTTIQALEQEGIDWSSLREAWQSLSAAARSSPGTGVSLEPSAPPPPGLDRPRRRASVAVAPLTDRVSQGRTRVADGLTDDIITRLAKLRVLLVIARGTTFALAERGVGVEEAGRILNVEYLVSGSVRCDAGRVSVRIELAETYSARIVWTDEIEGVADDTFAVLDTIIDRIVASIAEEIEAAECNRALLKPPSSLDAWEAYHRGLFHMYKFNGPDNQDAAQFFQQAIRLDPTFARAHAGLSFTHFQNAFLDLTPERDREIELAFQTAGRSVDADVRDPAAHWAMGRALWLRGEDRDSFAELEHSIELSPNFALGHYTLGFVHAQVGDPHAAIEATNYSRQLSPFDPLQFAMLASRALAHIRLGQVEEAADWAVKATGRPNAHVHILAIAVESLVLSDRRDEARVFAARIRERAPAYTVGDFLRAFRFDADTTRRLRKAAQQIGFDSGTGARTLR
jgi:DNA-binding SARP family transcriptional activator/TolB-like protein